MPDLKTILLVEDEALIAAGEKRLLEKEGYKVLHVLSGEKAVNLVCSKNQPVDLILMDINLGKGMDGTQAASQILQTHDIPIVFLSSHTEKEIVEKTEAITSYGYVVKNSSPTVLLVSIKMAFRLHSAHMQLRESEDRYRTLVEYSPDSLAIHFDGNLAYVNTALVKLLHASGPEDLVGKPYMQFVHPDYHEIVAERIRRSYEEHQSSTILDEKLITLDGHIINIEAITTSIQYQGKPASQVIIRDITERQQATLEIERLNLELQNHLADQTNRLEKEQIAHSQALTALQESEERFRAAQEISLDAFTMLRCIRDENNRIVDFIWTYANPVACQILKQPREKLVGQRLLQVLPGNLENKAQFERYTRIVETGQGNEMEEEYKSGNVSGWFRNMTVKLGDGVAVSFSDITQRKRAEARLKRSYDESDASFQMIFEKTMAGYVLTSPDGKFIKANAAFARMLGYSTEELCQVNFRDITHPDDLSISNESIRSLLAGEHDAYQFEKRYFHRNGSIVWVYLNIVLVRGNQNAPLYFIASIIDITQQKQAIEDHRQSVLMLKDAQRIAHLGSWHWDVLTNRLTWSDEIFRIFGVDPQTFAVTAENFEKTIHPDDYESFIQMREQMLAGQADMEIGHRVVRPTGEVRNVLERARVLSDENGRVLAVTGTVQDVTEREQADRARLESERLYRQMFVEHSAAKLLVDPVGGDIVQANLAASRFYGYPVETLQAMNINQINMLTPEQTHVEMDLAQKKQRNYFIFKHRLASGQICDVEVYSTPLQVGERQLLYSIIHDITARKQAEQALAVEKEKLDNILRGTNSGTWEWNIQTGSTVFNERWANIIGYTLEEISPVSIDTWIRFTHPDDLKASEEQLNRHFAGEVGYYQCEARMRHKNGEWVWVLDRGRVASWIADGKPELMYGTHQDITERKKADEYIQRLASQLRVILDTVTAGISHVRNRKIEWANVAHDEMFGYHAGETTGLETSVFYADRADFERFGDESFAHLAQGKVYSREVEMKKKNGSRFWCRLTGHLIDVDRPSDGSIWMIQDISQSKQFEQALMKSEKRYHDLFENAPVAIFQSSLDGSSVFDVNPAFAAMFGYESPADVRTSIKNIATEIFADPNRRNEILRIKAAHPEVNVFESVYQRKDGSTFVGELVLRAIPNADGQLRYLVGFISNVTERRQAEQALRQSENNFQTFFNGVDDLLFVLDANGYIIKANATACKRLRYIEEELAGQHVLMVHPPARRAEAGQIVMDMLSGKRRECPVPVMDKLGGLIEVETYITKGKWNGQDALFGVTKDISALKRSEEKFAKAFRMNSSLMAISTLNEGIYVDVNDAFCATLGYQREDVIGKSAVELMLFRDNAERQEMVKEFRENGCLKNKPFKIHTRDGVLMEGLMSGELIELDGKSHLLTMFFDLTERKKMEQELQEQRDFATQIINLMGQGLTVTDCEGRFEFVNPAYARLFGYETNDLVGKHPSDVTLPEFQAELAAQRKLRQSGKTSTYETSLLRADGSLAPVLITAVPRMYEESQLAGSIAVITDLTEQKKVEDQVRSLLHDKELLLREVHHRIKNNMNIITSLLNLQAEICDDDPAKLALQDASGRVQSMMVLYDKLYRSQDFSAVSIQDYIPALLEEVIRLFPQKDSITLKTQLDEIFLDAKLLSSIGIILNELASNSMKYAFPGRDGNITVLVTRQGQKISIVYGDDGVGLPETFSIENSTGFGMQLVSMLVQQIDGSLSIESGNGTCFKIDFEVQE